jgi:biopolymer transport protein ExbD
MKISEDDSDSAPQINIVPMIDVIFAILTFFIMATLFLTRSSGLPVNLPSAKTSSAQNTKQTKITVTIDAQDKIFIDRQPVAIQNLAMQVKATLNGKPEALVVINADTTVEHGQVIAVMDELRMIEGVKLGIATKKK